MAPLIGIALVTGLALLLRSSAKRPPPRPQLPPPFPEEEELPSELALSDPVEALRRYGTSADAARLADQGVDLSGLGYRPPGEG